MCYCPEMVVLGIDPGIEHVGWALLDVDQRNIYDGGAEHPLQFMERLRTWLHVWGTGYRPEIKHLVVEEWRQYDAVSRSGSDMPESRLIGRIEELAFLTGRTMEMSATRIKQHGFAYAAKIQLDVSGRTQHEKDAKAHLAWYLRGLDYGRHPTVR